MHEQTVSGRLSHESDDNLASQSSKVRDDIAFSGHNSSFLESFVGSFFQEKNIKWMLVVGAAIVFGSSLMLVTKAWPHWSPVLKYFTILGYTIAVYAAAEVSRRRLGLGSTYRVLHGLTVLLIPVCFLSLAWLSPGTAIQGVLRSMTYFGLLIPAIVFLIHASRRIFDNILRERQTTFLVSYGLLCVVGAIPSFSSPIFAFAFAIASWCVFTAGVVKVNRHTFWLAEQHQLPRVFGFLPIVLLGLQFVILVGTKSISAIPLQWSGFAVVLVAATVLMTTRTVVEVFRKRTGDLVRPLPLQIVIPLFCGLLFTVGGLVLSAYGFSYSSGTTYAIIPTALLASMLFGLTAKDTKLSAFVWAALFCFVIVYQCSPMLFSELVNTVRSATASAISRSRVPLSLYGVTYLPLLGLLALVSRRFTSRNKTLFADPIRHFVTIAAVVLFCISASDLVPLFIVSTINVFTFIGLAILFKDRRYIIAAIVALVVSAYSMIPACNDMGYTNIDIAWSPVLLSALSLLMTGFCLHDKLLNRIPLKSNSDWMRNQSRDRSFVQGFGCALALCVGFHWFCDSVLHFRDAVTHQSMLQYAFLIVSLMVYAIRYPRYGFGMLIWFMSAAGILRWIAGADLTMTQLINGLSFGFVGVSVVSYGVIIWLQKRMNLADLDAMRLALGFDAKLLSRKVPTNHTVPAFESVACFVVPLFDLCLVGLSCLLAAIHFPLILYPHWMALTGASQFLDFAFADSVQWSQIATVLWLIVATVITRNRTLGVATSLTSSLLLTALLIANSIILSTQWIIMVWCVSQMIVALVCYRIDGNEATLRLRDCVVKAACWIQVVFAVVGCFSLLSSMRVVSLVSLGTLAIVNKNRYSGKELSEFAILINWNLMLGVAAVAGCTGSLIPWVTPNFTFESIPLLLFTVAASVMLFDIGREKLDSKRCAIWATVLRTTLTVSLIYCFNGPVLPVAGIGFVTLAAILMIVAESIEAVKSNRESRVWAACGIGAVLGIFLLDQNIIALGMGVSQFVLLGLSVTALAINSFSQRDERLAVFRRPMLLVGQTLPSVVASLAILRESSGVAESSTAINAASLLFASCINGHQAWLTGKRRFSVGAIAMLNSAMFLYWHSLGFRSLELYLVPLGLSILVLVELLKKELPQYVHDPLRYIGALTILVSPVFDVLDGSWLHIFILLCLSVLVILVSIGLRIRALIYAGSAFLFADLVAMIIRSSINHPSTLWICCLVLGAGVIALAAYCENHRDKLLSNIRILSAELATWN